MFSQLTDDDFVARIEKNFLSRKKTGCLLLIISLAMIGVAGYFAYDMSNKILSIAHKVSYIGATSERGSAGRSTENVCRVLANNGGDPRLNLVRSLDG